jgi:streptogramin lyase
MYDPKSNKFTLVATCFGTHHLHFAEDASNTLWFSGGAQVLGWINTKMLDETGDTQKSQGWTAFVVDTNGDGKRGEYTEPNQPLDPNKDRRLNVGTYGIGVAPDGGVWTTVRVFPGFIMRTVPGSDPANTALTEIYEVPSDDAKTPGYGPRGMDVDRNGVVWTPLSSGHMASFDRRKCKVLNGPTAATGRHCPEGWTLHQFPGPQFKDFNETGQRRVELLHLGRPVQHVGSGRQYTDGDRQRQRVNLCARRRQVGQHARALPARLLYEGHGRTHRRSQHGLERPRHVDDLRPAHAVPSRRRQGHAAKVVKFQIRPDPLAR